MPFQTNIEMAAARLMYMMLSGTGPFSGLLLLTLINLVCQHDMM